MIQDGQAVLIWGFWWGFQQDQLFPSLFKMPVLVMLLALLKCFVATEDFS